MWHVVSHWIQYSRSDCQHIKQMYTFSQIILKPLQARSVR